MIRALRILPALLFITALLAFFFWLSPIHFCSDNWNPPEPLVTIDHEAEKYQRLNCILHTTTIPGNNPSELLSNLTDTPKPLSAEDFKKLRSQYPLIQYKITVDTPPLSRDPAYHDIHNPYSIGSSFIAIRLASWNSSKHRFDYSLKIVNQNSAAVAFTQRQTDSNLELAISTRFYNTPYDLLHPNVPPGLRMNSVSIDHFQEYIRFCPADRPETFAWVLTDTNNTQLLMVLELNPPPSAAKTMLLTSPIFPLP